MILTPVEEMVMETPPFIEANTLPMNFSAMQNDHIIPVFVKDNEPAISHTDFIQVVQGVAQHCFNTRQSQPMIRVSHPIKGRILEAKNKPAKELLEREKTLYYERMMFIIELPAIKSTIGGNSLSLTIGGVKAFNRDNLYNNKGSYERFKIFIGFKVKVCTNLCVWTDGFASEVKVTSLQQLEQEVFKLYQAFDAEKQLNQMENLMNIGLTQQQFTQFVGKARLYHTMQQKKEFPLLLLSDNQLSQVVKNYLYNRNGGPPVFACEISGDISLWNFYNLLTQANKSSYIDTFLNRGTNALDFSLSIAHALEENEPHWFL